MSKQDIENIKKRFSDGVSKAYESAVGVESQINDATANFSSAVRKSLSFGLEQFSSARSRLEDAGGTATAHYKSTEDEILAAVRTGVKKSIHWCNEYPLFAYGGAVAALFVFPAPRSFVFKNIFGALQSQESAFRAATERFATLSETAQTLSKQKAEAVESATAALDALAAAHTQAADASRQLATVEAQLSRTSTGFDEVREALAPLKHKDAITTRSDVARSASEVRTDHKDVTNVIAKLQAYEV